MASNMFNKMTQGVQKITKFSQQTMNEANKVKDIIAEIQTQDDIYYTSLWEISEEVEICRGCDTRFKTRKHHCRSCAGVFCDDCCPSLIPNSFERSLLPSSLPVDEDQAVRICNGCRRGECPSKVIKDKLRRMLDDELGIGNNSNKIDKLHAKVTAKVNEVVGLDNGQPKQGLRCIKLGRGSYYGENSMPSKAGNRPLAVGGYFEFYNKSKDLVAIKLHVGGQGSKFEIPRPSYLAVPPKEAVYGFFDHEHDSLDLIILYENPNPLPNNASVIFDTKAPGVHPDRISPCARVDGFRSVNIVSINSIGKNVLLKYKGAGLVEPRSGNSLDRVGVFGRLQGKRFMAGKLDYQTNIENDNIHTRFQL